MLGLLEAPSSYTYYGVSLPYSMCVDTEVSIAHIPTLIAADLESLLSIFRTSLIQDIRNVYFVWFYQLICPPYTTLRFFINSVIDLVIDSFLAKSRMKI